MKNFKKYTALLVAALLWTVGAMGQTYPEVQTLPFSFEAKKATTTLLIDTTGYYKAVAICPLPEWIAVHEQRQANSVGENRNWSYEPAAGGSWPIPPDTVDNLRDAIYKYATKGFGYPSNAKDTVVTTNIGNAGWDVYTKDGKVGIMLAAHASQAYKKVRGIVVAVNTKGKNNVKVSWTSSNAGNGSNHVTALALQYKVGSTPTSFVTIANTEFAPTGALTTDYECVLPAELENQDSVYLRWVYWQYSTGTAAGGTRRPLGLTNVSIAETPATFAATYPNTSGTTASGATLNFKTDLPSKVFFVVKTSATAPTASELLADAALDSAAVSSTETNKNITGLSASTQYYVHYLLKMGGLTSTVSTISFTTEAPVPAGLEFITGYPNLSDTAYNSIKLNAKTSKAGTLFYLLSTTQQNFANATALAAATGVLSAAIDALTEKNIDTANLTANTSYYLYCAAADASDSTAVAELQFTTKRNLVHFVASYPKTTGVVYNGFKLLSKVDKDASLYYVVSTGEKSFANAAALIADAGAVGPKAIVADKEDTISVTGLNSSTLYYVYAVAKNADNEETVVAPLQATTSSNAPSFVSATVSNITANTFDYTVKSNKNATLYYVVQEIAQNPIYTAAQLAGTPGVQTQALTANTEWTTTFTGKAKERRYNVYGVLYDGIDYSAVKRTVKNGDFFGIEGQLTSACERSGTPRPIETVAQQNFDISNIPNSKIISNLADSAIWKTPLGNDFSNTLTRTVRDTAKKTDGNTYTITVKNLLPTDNLPLNLSFSGSNPSTWTKDTKGWAAAGVDAGQPSVIRFSTNNVSFITAFSDIPDSIAYELTTVSGAFIGSNNNPEFLVEASVDGSRWTTLEYFNKDRIIPGVSGNTTTKYINGLGDSIRFVRFWYKVRDGRSLNVNNVKVSRKVGYPYFTASYPQLNSINSQGIDLALKLDAAGTVYYKYSTTPLTLTASQLEAQGTTATLAAATEQVEQIRSLSENTPYYLYLVAKNGDGKYSAVKEYHFRTLSDFPDFVAGYPQFGVVGKDSMVVNINVQKDSKVHYLITSTVKAAGYTNADLMAEAHDSVTVSANVPKSINKKNLTWETKYYLYFTTRDDQGNMATLAKLDTTTQSPDRNANIITFAIAGQAAPAVIDAAKGLVTVQVPSDMPLTSIAPTFTLHSPQAILKTTTGTVLTSGVTTLDFSDTVRCIVVSEDATIEKSWRIKVNASGSVVPPNFVANSVGNITDNSFDYIVKADKNATLYYLVQEQAQNPIYTAAELVAAAGVQTQALTAYTEWTTTFTNKPRERRYYVYSVLADQQSNYSIVQRVIKSGELFTIAGALTPTSNRATTPARTLELVVPQYIDIDNIPNDMIISSLPDSSVWVTPLPNDYSDVVLRSVKDTAKNTTTNYAIMVKNVLPADNLPLNLTFSNNNPSSAWSKTTKGWATAGADLAGYPSVIRMGTNNVSFIVAISDISGSISYELNTVGAAFTNKNPNPEYVVEASANGVNWITLEYFTKDRMVPQTATSYTNELGDSIRFIRYYYKVYGANLNVNKINITRKSGYPYFAEGYPKVAAVTSSGLDTLAFALEQTATVSYKFYTTPQTLTAAQLDGDGTASHENILVGNTFLTSVGTLQPKTDYYLYVVAKNGSGKFSAVKEFRFRTLSDTPEFSPNYPQLGDIGKKSIAVKLKVEKVCPVYYLADTVAKPAGYTNADLVADAKARTISVTAANRVQDLNITGLTPGKHYYMYFTTKDNLDSMAALATLEATTLPADRNANIITFSILGEVQQAVIDTIKGLVLVAMPAETDLTNLTPTFTLHSEAAQLWVVADNRMLVSNVSVVDFTDTLYCKVIAEEPSVTKQWRIKVNLDNNTAVAKNELSLTLYPNPFTNELHINCPDEIALVQIVSMQGVVVYTQAGSNLVQANDIPKGVYVLKVQAKSGKVGAKLVIKQ